MLDAGEIVEATPPRRLVIRWQNQFKPELKVEGDSLCTMEIEQSGSAVKLSITHTIDRSPSKFIDAERRLAEGDLESEVRARDGARGADGSLPCLESEEALSAPAR
jgi:hypothetical protein